MKSARGSTSGILKIGQENSAATQHTDSLMSGGESGLIELTPEWQQYEIDLTGKDLSSVVSALSWTCSVADNGSHDLSFHLDDIYFVKLRSEQ